jgi:RNA polymerase sigma-70 factor (ECF subfamily)
MQLFGLNLHLNSREQLKEESLKPDWLTLVNRCKNGDRGGQKAMYDALARKMFAVCLRYMGNRDDAEDILQDGFVTLFSKLESYSGAGSFEGWARKIFVNTALMSLRKKDVLRQSEDVDTAWNISASEPTPVQKIGFRELSKMISELPTGFRTVFNMYIIEGYSHKEIAETLGVSEATSRSQLQRARTMLQGKIKEKY